MSEKIEKAWLDHLVSARTVHDALVVEGVVREEKMHLVFKDAEDRKKEVRHRHSHGESTRQIAADIGVSQRTVVNDLAEQNYSESEQNCSPKSTRELLSQSDQNDWRTPRKYLDAARATMGAIDLDPASGAEANETVLAAEFYTKEDNGLQRPWKGRVWLNPPYGGEARLFVERLIKEYQVGNVLAACTLLNSHPTETKWFQQLFDYPICFINGRIDFGGPSRAVSSTSTHGSAVVYLGSDIGRFKDEFSKFGAVVRRL